MSRDLRSAALHVDVKGATHVQPCSSMQLTSGKPAQQGALCWAGYVAQRCQMLSGSFISSPQTCAGSLLLEVIHAHCVSESASALIVDLRLSSVSRGSSPDGACCGC